MQSIGAGSTIRRKASGLALWWAALLVSSCSLGSQPPSADPTADETVWTASGECGRRGKQLRCGSPTRIVLASYPTMLTLDMARMQVWSSLAEQFGRDPFEVEQTDPKHATLVVKYTGRARPFVECGRAGTVSGKVQMKSVDTSPGTLDSSMQVQLEDAGGDRTAVRVTTRHLLKHKDESIESPIEILDRSVAPVGDGRVCWSTGALERSAFTPGQKPAP